MPIGSKELIVENLDKIEDSLLVEELKKAKEELFNALTRAIHKLPLKARIIKREEGDA